MIVNLSDLKALTVLSRKTWLAVCVVVLAMAATVFSQTSQSGITQRANRITREVTSGEMVTVPGTVHPLARRATDLGPVNSEMQMNSMTLNVSLTSAQQSELETLISEQHNPKSELYHQWLTQEQYGARFGLTDSDLNKVTSWLTSQGFKVKSVVPSRNAIYFSGKAWQVESAFHTQLHQYQSDGETHFANATELRVPAAIGSVLMNVRGLDNFRPKPHVRTIIPEVVPNYTSGSLKHYLTPGDWATIYNVTSIYNAGYTGTGAHVVVVGQTYAPQTVIDSFRSAAGLSATKLNPVCIDTSVSCTGSSAISSAGDLGEADLDIEWAGGIAKNATVDYVYAPYSDVTANTYSVFDALQYAVTTYKVSGAVVPVVSMSYTDCELDFYYNNVFQTSYFNFVQSIGQQANTQGQTIVVSSGDTGAAGCDVQGTAANVPALYGQTATIPVDSPNYTGVGGTMFSGDTSSPATYWNQTAGVVNSALGYIPETTWNESDSTGLFASGGGVSLFFTKPTWQPTPSNFTGTAGRFIPDVSFSSAGGHDGYLMCSQDGYAVATYGTTCSSGFGSSQGYLFVAGGTSAAAPSFAGMLTLLTQKYGNLGNINPTLYGLATTNPAVFHDITTGNNNVSCTTGTTGCTNGTMGWSAVTGYDLATGLGSIDAGALYTALGSSTTLAATTTSVSASPSSVTIGDTTQLNATVSSAAAGTIGGSVTFTVGGKTIGSAPVSGGTATMSSVPVTVAGGFSAGSDTITATYSGDSTYAASSGTTTLTVAALPTYTFTATATTTTIGAGSSTTITFNLASTNYAGTVSFNPVVTSSNGTAANVSVSMPSVTLTNGGTATGTLTIAPNASAANHAPSVPWKAGGALIFCTVLLAPFTFRRRRALTVLLGASAIVLAVFMVACSGGSGSTTPSKTATTTTVAATPSSVKLNGTTSLTATVSPSSASGTVTFMVGSTSVGSGTLSSGTATVSNVTASTTNGFTAGTANTVTASYGGDSTYAASSGTGTVTVAAVRTYTVTVTPTGSGTVTNPAAVVITVTVP